MGEDETLPKNRIVLICQNCKLVNGQAPPGTKSLSEIGQWRCHSCGSLNGEADEAAKVVNEMKEKLQGKEKLVAATESKSEDGERDVQSAESGDDGLEPEVVEPDGDDSASDIIEAKPKKGRPKGSRTKT
jgi:hypothetical protein